MTLPLTAYPTEQSSRDLCILLEAKSRLFPNLPTCHMDTYLALQRLYFHSSCYTLSTLLLTEPALHPLQADNLSTTLHGSVSYHDVFEKLYFCSPLDVQLIERNRDVNGALKVMDEYAQFLLENWPYSTSRECGWVAGLAVKEMVNGAVKVARGGEGREEWPGLLRMADMEMGEAARNM